MTYPQISLDGAIVVVTGGARGIGKATAELFAAKGATVCVGDLDGGDFTVDVTSRDSFADFVAAVLDRHGRIDVLVNNAGVMPLGDFLSEEDAVSRTTFDVNVWGLIHGMRLVLPHMIERGRGHIVNVASMAGKLVIPGMAVYNASKFAAVGLSAAVREEYRDSGVSVTPCCQVPCGPGSHRASHSGGPADRGTRGRRAGDRQQRRQPARRNHRAPLSGGLGPARTQPRQNALMRSGPQGDWRPSGADIGRARCARRLRGGDRGAGQGAAMTTGTEDRHHRCGRRRHRHRGHVAAGGISRLHDPGEGRRRRRRLALEPLPRPDV